MAKLDITQQLKTRFMQPLPECSDRRIVIWSDPNGEFADEFYTLAGEEGVAFANEALPAGAVRCIEVKDGNTFAAKRTVCRLAQNENFLLYRRRGSRQLDGDWFADVEMYAEHFQADYGSLLIEELGANNTQDVRDAIQDMGQFFRAKDRIARFAKMTPRAQTSADVLMGVLAVSLGALAPTPEAIVRAYMMSLFNEGKEEGFDVFAPYGNEESKAPSALAVLEKYGALDAFKKFVQRTVGYTGDIANGHAMAAHILVTALSRTMSADALVGLESYIAQGSDQICLAVVRDWMALPGDDDRRVLYEICRHVEDGLRLAMRFEGLSLEKLMDSDVFPGINEAILLGLMNSMAHGVDRSDEAKRVCSIRKEMKWYGRVEPYFDCLASAASMHEFYSAHVSGFDLSRPEEVWDAYVEDWWRMDAYYRAFCTAFSECLHCLNDHLDGAVHELSTWANNLYTNWYLVKSNECWVRSAQSQWENSSCVNDRPTQRLFYDNVVASELASAKRVVVVVSDALRYEVACELKDVLERKTQGRAEVKAMQAVFPSETRFGMAALLPHGELRYDTASDEVLVDGKCTVSTDDRARILRDRCANGAAIQYTDLMKMSRSERKEFASDLELIYVYHNTIDAAGHGSIGRDVFAACNDAIADMEALVRAAVSDLGASRVVITADHGFLFSQEDLPEADQISRHEIDGTLLKLERRFACADANATSNVFVKMGMGSVDGGENTWWAARDCIRIKASGSKNFVHGGVSLQELCVPVVRFRNMRSSAKGFVEKRYASLQLLSTDRRITSNVFNLDFYQKDQVAGKVLPCEYELVLTDAAGNPVSDVRSAHADKTSPNEQERKVHVKFALKLGISPKETDSYYLVARSKQTGEEVTLGEFHIHLAFVAVDNFGF